MNLRNCLVYLVITTILATCLVSGCQVEQPLPKKGISEKPHSKLEFETTISATHITFAVFGDNRPDSPLAPQPETFHQILKLIQDHQVNLVFSVGDIVRGSRHPKVYRKQYEDFKSLVSNLLNCPIYVAPGNHDLQNPTGRNLFKKFISSQTYFSFDYQGHHFIILNTEEIGEAGKIGSNQLRWLKDDLEKNKGKTSFIFMHRPLYSIMNPQGDPNKHLSFVDKENEAAVRKLVEKYRVEAVFAGHEHFFNFRQINGVNYFITGCSGSSPYTDKRHGGFPHFLLVNVKPTTVTYQVITSKGQAIDPADIPAPQF
jgi:UDP-2,3-diacylglucosamine pyrophosphatase LpxH